MCGGGPKGGAYDHYIGGQNWSHGKAFANGFKGVCDVFVTGKTGLHSSRCVVDLLRPLAAFSFGELNSSQGSLRTNRDYSWYRARRSCRH